MSAKLWQALIQTNAVAFDVDTGINFGNKLLEINFGSFGILYQKDVNY